MTEPARERFIADRVRAMATVVLTRRSDLFVVETKQTTGLDYHVVIDRDDKPMRLQFGVLLRGVPSPVTTDRANRVLGLTMDFFGGLRKFTYPVCLFFFTMREEQQFFSWLAEPAVTANGPKLVHRTAADCVPLTDALLEDVIEQVVAWYDAFEFAVVT